MLPLERYFCLTSSVVYAAPVLRTALEEAVEDSVEVVDSELADLAPFLAATSAGLLGALAGFAAAAAFLCGGDSSDSSALDAACGKHSVSL